MCMNIRTTMGITTIIIRLRLRAKTGTPLLHVILGLKELGRKPAMSPFSCRPSEL